MKKFLTRLRKTKEADPHQLDPNSAKLANLLAMKETSMIAISKMSLFQS